MSELINRHDSRATIRWKLLTGVSALALTAYVSSGSIAMADDAGKPQIWIELGGQLSRLEDGQETFNPPNMTARPSIFTKSQKFERPPLFGFDENADISFQPENSDWVFSASVRYGRSASKRHVHQQTNPAPFSKYELTSFPTQPGRQTYIAQPNAAKFADTKSRTSAHNAVLDFSAGKDVGLGLFGNSDGSYVISAGVRFAQFVSKTNIALRSGPDWHFHYGYFATVLPSVPSSVIKLFFPTATKFVQGQAYHSHAASLQASRSFHGVGPSLSWKASAPFAGNAKDSELSLDWSVNAAMLFGRQVTKVGHHASGRYHAPLNTRGGPSMPGSHVITYDPAPVGFARSRNIMVPNVGGSVGISWLYDDAKISFGYKADFFFNAIDGGIDARKSENRAFYGPYASISIGIGD